MMANAFACRRRLSDRQFLLSKRRDKGDAICRNARE